jgi:branched-chain amino acid transport system ATP-binding protein
LTQHLDVDVAPVPTGPLALVLDGITAGYGRAEVLHEVTMVVPSSSVVALFGANGAGKTTLMKVAAGFVRPTGGTVRLNGQDITRASAHRRARLGICDVPEGRGIFPSLTVRENLVLQSPRGRESEAIEMAGEAFPALARRLRQLAGSLSGGEQQMLALSRAYVTDPKVVLVDEVSLGLSPVAVDKVYDFLLTLRDRGTTLLLIEQYVRRALELADHVYVMEKGRIVLDAAGGEVPSEAILDAYLGYGGESESGAVDAPPRTDWQLNA